MNKISTVYAIAVLLVLWTAGAHAGGGHGHRGYGGGHYRGHHGGHGRGHFRGHYRGHFGGHYGGFRYGGRRGHFSFNFGSPLWWGAHHYAYPYVYAPAPVIVQTEPQVYIQRAPGVSTAQPTAPPQAAALWYYCPQPAGYYPYVQNCTQAWVSVDPNTVAPPVPSR